jgi:deazaflavin-dependent oxidoreductase (nitroreductase family)
VADRSAGALVRARMVDPVVRALLRSPAHRLLSGCVLLLEYTGRRSGQHHVLPVMYAPTGEDLVVLAGHPTTKTWWRNFGPGPRSVQVTAGGGQRNYAARRPDVGTDEREQAVRAYRGRFPRGVPDPAVPVVVLSPSGGVEESRRPPDGAVRRPTSLAVIRGAHTLAWFLIEGCVAYLLWAGFAGRSDRRALVAGAVVTGECLVFAGNGFRCPLTGLAEDAGAASGSVTDIYLPRWFARNLPALHVPLLVLILWLHGRNRQHPGTKVLDLRYAVPSPVGPAAGGQPETGRGPS